MWSGHSGRAGVLLAIQGHTPHTVLYLKDYFELKTHVTISLIWLIVIYSVSFCNVVSFSRYVVNRNRGQGLAKALVSSMSRRLYSQGFPVYCFVEEENTLSYNLYTNLGFTEDPQYRAAWFDFNSL
jgi:GNAT superfamily N-acetyltransferase